jgi:hypothetical protein
MNRLVRCPHPGAWAIGAILAAVFGSAPALADVCAHMAQRPTIAVKVQVLEPRLDLTQGMRAISDNPHNAVPRWLEGEAPALGATSVSVDGKWELTLRTMPRGDGGLCVGLQHIEMHLSAHTRVLVAKEIKKDSCVWKVVIDHERKHVRLDRGLFPKLAQLIEQKARREIPGAVAAASMEEGNELHSATLNRFLASVAAEFERQRNEKQLAIDSPQEYQRTSKICGNAAVAKILNRAGY